MYKGQIHKRAMSLKTALNIVSAQILSNLLKMVPRGTNLHVVSYETWLNTTKLGKWERKLLQIGLGGKALLLLRETIIKMR